jgi:hypothetical protein
MQLIISGPMRPTVACQYICAVLGLRAPKADPDYLLERLRSGADQTELVQQGAGTRPGTERSHVEDTLTNSQATTCTITTVGVPENNSHLFNTHPYQLTAASCNAAQTISLQSPVCVCRGPFSRMLGHSGVGACLSVPTDSASGTRGAPHPLALAPCAPDCIVVPAKASGRGP